MSTRSPASEDTVRTALGQESFLSREVCGTRSWISPARPPPWPRGPHRRGHRSASHGRRSFAGATWLLVLLVGGRWCCLLESSVGRLQRIKVNQELKKMERDLPMLIAGRLREQRRPSAHRWPPAAWRWGPRWKAASPAGRHSLLWFVGSAAAAMPLPKEHGTLQLKFMEKLKGTLGGSVHNPSKRAVACTVGQFNLGCLIRVRKRRTQSMGPCGRPPPACSPSTGLGGGALKPGVAEPSASERKD